MEYTTFESTSSLSGEAQQFISVEKEDGSFEVFAADETNPRYIQFLAELEEQA